MYIDFIKQKENEDCVWYKFETLVADNDFKPSLKKVSGVFSFDKRSQTTSESLIIIEEESDELFDEHDRVRLACLRTMYYCKQANEYPEKISKAFGG